MAMQGKFRFSRQEHKCNCAMAVNSANKWLGLMAVTCLLAVTGCSENSEPVKARNLLLITIDSMRPDRLEQAETLFRKPLALDSFRKRSTDFQSAIASSPSTLPAAAAVLTGQHPRALGYPSPTRPLPDNVPTLAEVFGSAGFETKGIVGPFSLGDQTGIGRGFDSYDAPRRNRREDYTTAERARHYLQSKAEQGPPGWFLWVHLNGPHGPNSEWDNAFGGIVILSRMVEAEAVGNARQMALAGDNRSPGKLPLYQQRQGILGHDAYMRDYHARFLAGDWFATELVDALKATDQYEQTAICIVGTHGESLGEQRQWFTHGNNLGHEVLKVPLWIRVPGKSAQIDQRVASHVDLFPTLLNLFDLKAPTPTQGIDLFGPLDGSGGVAISETYPPISMRREIAATGAKWKAVLNPAGKLRLYDLSRDPSEEHPIDSETDESSAQVVKALREFEQQEPAVQSAPISLNATQKGWLDSLGYSSAEFE